MYELADILNCEETDTETNGVLHHARTCGEHVCELVRAIETYASGNSYFAGEAAIEIREAEVVVHLYFM